MQLEWYNHGPMRRTSPSAKRVARSTSTPASPKGHNMVKSKGNLSKSSPPITGPQSGEKLHVTGREVARILAQMVLRAYQAHRR